MQDTFYDVQGLSPKDRKALCRETWEVAREWWVDKLDCKVSPRRTLVDMSWDRAMGMLGRHGHFTVVHRRSHEHSEYDYGEIGFRTMATRGPDYFLWIHIGMDDLARIVAKYGLNPVRHT